MNFLADINFDELCSGIYSCKNIFFADSAPIVQLNGGSVKVISDKDSSECGLAEDSACSTDS